MSSKRLAHKLCTIILHQVEHAYCLLYVRNLRNLLVESPFRGNALSGESPFSPETFGFFQPSQAAHRGVSGVSPHPILRLLELQPGLAVLALSQVRSRGLRREHLQLLTSKSWQPPRCVASPRVFFGPHLFLFVWQQTVVLSWNSASLGAWDSDELCLSVLLRLVLR